ncbi:hypothetical protein KAR91_68505 [Candidatus Pacearchaeota archaeon]|nr:hypothetical protein [Candidatus Pacearchaeota archaeon]
MTKKQTENLPAVVLDRFVIPIDETPVAVELAALMNEGDTKGFEEAVSSIPYIRIAQKDLKDEGSGDVLIPAGGFRMDLRSVPDIPDVDGQEGLILTVCFDQNVRTYWKDLNDTHPACRSGDRIKGEGEPGGYCLNCPLSVWGSGKSGPTGPGDCKNEIKLFCLDHNTLGMFYIFTLGPSGLRPYDDLKQAVSRQKVPIAKKQVSIPLFYKKIHVKTQYKLEPQGHYIPLFTIVGDVTPEQAKEIKSLRSKFMGMLSHAPELNADDDSDSELPEGATRVDSGEGEVLPY